MTSDPPNELFHIDSNEARSPIYRAHFAVRRFLLDLRVTSLIIGRAPARDSAALAGLGMKELISRGTRQLFSALLLVVLIPGCFSSWNGAHDYLRQAEESARRQDWDQALINYRQHIDYRLSLKERPEWENPWFYLLMIGDIELGRDKPAEAVQNYEKAFERGVEKNLVSDRLRLAATWYEQHDRLPEALTLLTRHRDKDEILFDIMLDRLSRELTRREDSAGVATGPAAYSSH